MAAMVRFSIRFVHPRGLEQSCLDRWRSGKTYYWMPLILMVSMLGRYWLGWRTCPRFAFIYFTSRSGIETG